LRASIRCLNNLAAFTIAAGGRDFVVDTVLTA
jgi:hypothetical protein